MGGWPGMMDPLKMHGGFSFYLRPMENKVGSSFSYQLHGILFKPYRVLMSPR